MVNKTDISPDLTDPLLGPEGSRMSPLVTWGQQRPGLVDLDHITPNSNAGIN